MAVSVNKSVTVSSTVRVDELDVVYLSATINLQSNISNINKSISDYTAYKNNKVEIDTHIATFEEDVNKISEIVSK